MLSRSLRLSLRLSLRHAGLCTRWMQGRSEVWSLRRSTDQALPQGMPFSTKPNADEEASELMGQLQNTRSCRQYLTLLHKHLALIH